MDGWRQAKERNSLESRDSNHLEETGCLLVGGVAKITNTVPINPSTPPITNARSKFPVVSYVQAKMIGPITEGIASSGLNAPWMLPKKARP